MDFRFVHAADLHLDTPFQGIGRASPEVGDALLDASLDAWDDLVRLTIERDAAFLLLGGDIYDGAERGVRAQLRFLRGIERLGEHGIQVHVVHGNHDPLDGWSAIRRSPPNLVVYGAEGVTSVGIEKEDIRIATVHGISYSRRDVTENLALRFRRGPETGIHIGLLHCNVGGQPDHEASSPCSIEDLRRAGMDYWALGHIHRHGVMSRGDQWVVYSGNIQGRSPKPSELGPKGAIVVDVQGSRLRSAEFQALDHARFLELEVDLSTAEDIPALEAQLAAGAAELREANAGRGLIIRAVISGRGRIHRDLTRPAAIEDVLKVLRERASGAPFLWWESIRDRSKAEMDRAAIARRGDFSSELLRTGAGLLDDPGKLESFLAEKLPGLERQSIRRWLEDARADSRSLLAEAEDLALDLLERDGEE
jgi:DNA repair protein SbcD/Mre11